MRVALVPAAGIGDSLLMMIASHAFTLRGHFVTTYHAALPELQNWFPEQHFSTFPIYDEEWGYYDLVIAENDNSARIGKLKEFHAKGLIKRLSIFYPTFFANKHTRLPEDQIFDPLLPMADNIAIASSNLLKEPCSKQNGLSPPTSLKQHLHSRVIIHATSSNPKKNWPLKKYIALAQALKKRGYEPLFIGSSAETHIEKALISTGLPCKLFHSLDELAACIYESSYLIGNDSVGGHLASCLGLPTLIIANEPERMRLWRPGWHPGVVVTAPRYLPNLKGLRLRTEYWQTFLSVRKVLRTFLTHNRTGRSGSRTHPIKA